MKKHYILLAAACALIACDPIEEDGTFDTIPVSSEALAEGFNLVQTDKDGNPAADGNYFKFTTNPARIVKVYNFKADGSENILAVGSSGEFSIAPSRGSNTDQVFYVCIYDAEGEKIETTKTVNVYVKQNLSVAEKLFCSDAGRKVYKWNDSKVFWGNMGYCGGDGSLVYSKQEAKWWGIGVNDTTTVSEDFETQLQHSVTGQLTGEESLDAYMVFTEDGVIEKYDANGSKLNETTYEVIPQTENTEWAAYRLKTGENSVLWPFEINAGGKYVTEFDVVYISPSAMTLVYPDGGAFDKLGGWGEATFWQFKAADVEGTFAGVDNTSKSWTWNDELTFWGNMGYCGGDGSLVYSKQEGKWWGIGVTDSTTVSEDFEGQLKHSVTGQLTGEEDLNAYFTMYENGDFVKFDANGNVLSSTTWSFDADKAVKNGGATWCSGRLITGENSVLWPFEINAGGKYVTEFEVVYIDDNHMTLVYPDEGAFDKLGGWGEATFWQFKAVEIK